MASERTTLLTYLIFGILSQVSTEEINMCSNDSVSLHFGSLLIRFNTQQFNREDEFPLTCGCTIESTDWTMLLSFSENIFFTSNYSQIASMGEIKASQCSPKLPCLDESVHEPSSLTRERTELMTYTLLQYSSHGDFYIAGGVNISGDNTTVDVVCNHVPPRRFATSLPTNGDVTTLKQAPHNEVTKRTIKRRQDNDDNKRITIIVVVVVIVVVLLALGIMYMCLYVRNRRSKANSAHNPRALVNNYDVRYTNDTTLGTSDNPAFLAGSTAIPQYAVVNKDDKKKQGQSSADNEYSYATEIKGHSKAWHLETEKQENVITMPIYAVVNKAQKHELAQNQNPRGYTGISTSNSSYPDHLDNLQDKAPIKKTDSLNDENSKVDGKSDDNGQLGKETIMHDNEIYE